MEANIHRQLDKRLGIIKWFFQYLTFPLFLFVAYPCNLQTLNREFNAKVCSGLRLGDDTIVTLRVFKVLNFDPNKIYLHYRSSYRVDVKGQTSLSANLKTDLECYDLLTNKHTIPTPIN